MARRFSTGTTPVRRGENSYGGVQPPATGYRDYLHQPDFDATFRPIIGRANEYARQSLQDYLRMQPAEGVATGPGGRPRPVLDRLRSIGAGLRTAVRDRFGFPPLEADVAVMEQLARNQAQRNIVVDPVETPYFNAIGARTTGVAAPGTGGSGMAPGMVGKAQPYGQVAPGTTIGKIRPYSQVAPVAPRTATTGPRRFSTGMTTEQPSFDWENWTRTTGYPYTVQPGYPSEGVQRPRERLLRNYLK